MPVFIAENIKPGLVQLSNEEAAHAQRVLRLKTGDPVTLLDGRGSRGAGHVADIGKKFCSVTVSTVDYTEETRPSIHIAIAPTKSIDRFEFFLEKATELGVNRITPLLCEHSERKRLRHDRCLKVLTAAMKQSRRSWLPTMDELTALPAFLKKALPEHRCLRLVPRTT